MKNESKSENLSDQVYRRLIDLIADGAIKPTSVISHRQLAQTLQVSKQPINIALKRLEREGIVELIPRIGTRICPVNAEEMWGMLQWRIALELQTISLACEWIEAEQLEMLCQKARRLDELMEQDISLNDRNNVEVDFHLYLAECSGCRVLKDKLSELNIYYLKSLLCELLQMKSDEPCKPIVTHKELVEAIRSGDPSHAVSQMKKHLEESSDMYLFASWYRRNRRLNR